MKKLSVFIAATVCSLVFSFRANAQASESKFVGKWILQDTSKDDKNFMYITRDGEKLGGYFTGEKGENKLIFTKIEEKENSMTCYFSAQGYDCYLFLESKDEKHLEGTMMDMFDYKATRVEETDKK
ncbi:hypothetical protein [Flavobacterium notoginsengisoli]|uniref:hypothetical protein n=1 Tax=Flavobacterium notoginsengisoli TaxID=1478199 RepID=UPI003638459F